MSLFCDFMYTALIKILAFVVLHIDRPKPTALIQPLVRKTWIDMIEVADNGTDLREIHTIFFPKRLMRCCTTVKKKSQNDRWRHSWFEREKNSSGNPCGREWLSRCFLFWPEEPEINILCYFSFLGLKDVLHNSLVPVKHTVLSWW